MRPTGRLLLVILLWGVSGVVASFQPRFTILWVLLGVLIGTVALVDAILVWLQPRLQVTRKLPGRFALGIQQMVSLELEAEKPAGLYVGVFDGLPPESECSQLPWRERIPKGEVSLLEYPVKLLRRGRVHFEPCHVLQYSPVGFWARSYQQGEREEVPVYPNYEPIVQLSIAALEHREAVVGIVQKNRIGQTREFHQLRDYQEGDALSQIDWKATSRRLNLISREYREQRNQNIILAVDCGRRMRSREDGLPQFDHCLNAMLLLSYVALRQGDRVGILGFGGTDSWLPPLTGEHSMTAILNHLYDFETSTAASDFIDASEKLLVRQSKRSLVILLTNLRAEDSDELVPALQLLRRKHLVAVASLRESSLDPKRDRSIASHTEALRCTSLHQYLEERTALLETLKSHGVLTLDSTAAELPLALSNRYLDIKAQGLL